ncbi:MAG: hemerythrin domain-containing protein [Methanobacterium sp.]
MTKGDLYKILKEEHDGVKELLKETIESGKKDRFPAIKSKLKVHMAGEENFLYPPLEFVDEENVKQNEYEHDLAWNKLIFLDNTSEDEPEWMIELKELNDLIIKHVDREEKILFPEASKTLSEEAEEDIMKLMEETKEENL